MVILAPAGTSNFRSLPPAVSTRVPLSPSTSLSLPLKTSAVRAPAPAKRTNRLLTAARRIGVLPRRASVVAGPFPRRRTSGALVLRPPVHLEDVRRRVKDCRGLEGLLDAGRRDG